MASNIFDVLTRVKFVGQDFDTYVQEVAEFLQTNYPDDYNDYTNNNLGVALLQIIAYAAQNLAFYINQRTTNLYLSESTSQVAISYLARMLNYDIRPASAARCDVTIRLDGGPYSFPVVINKGFRFNAERGLTYEYRGDNSIIFAPGEVEKTFEVQEGKTIQNIFVSNGLENQIFQLAGIEEGYSPAVESFKVFVATELWTERRRITFDELPIYEVNYFSRPPEIKFGDGIAGLIPPNGAQITVNFVITNGVAGNIASNGILSAADSLIASNTTIPVTVISSTASTGGQDPQDFREVKSKAPEFFQAQGRAITKRDYDAIVNSYPGIAKGDAQIIRSIDQDITLNSYLDGIVDAVSGVSGTAHYDVINAVTGLRNYLGDVISDTCQSNTVQVSVLSKDMNNYYTSTTPELREELRLHLEDINDVVHVVKVVDGVSGIIPADIEIELAISPNAVEDDVLERVKLSLLKNDTEPYGLLILRNYGESLYLSDLYQTIRDAPANKEDLEFFNIKILGPINKLDSDGNLIISKEKQEIIQPGNINIKIIPKVLFVT